MKPSDKKAMLQDPALYWGIYEYVQDHDLNTESACQRHKGNELWGKVYMDVDNKKIPAIKKEVEWYQAPMNATCGTDKYKWMVTRDFTCFLLHTQLGIPHTTELKSF